jgi:hypothetical protein
MPTLAAQNFQSMLTSEYNVYLLTTDWGQISLD